MDYMATVRRGRLFCRIDEMEKTDAMGLDPKVARSLTELPVPCTLLMPLKLTPRPMFRNACK